MLTIVRRRSRSSPRRSRTPCRPRSPTIRLGGDPAEVEEHIGAETFAALPLRFVDGPAGLRGLGLTARDGAEIALRAPSAAPGLAELAARTSRVSGAAGRSGRRG
ncbi:hypothetical protein AB0L25_01190 [Spirillospora sp. NPDC052242]